jgi:molybdopterin converting factor small subunit
MSSAVTVRVPTILRTYTGGSSTVTADGATVGEVIDNLESAHPGIRARVVDETGALRRFVNIYLDDEDIRFGDGLDSQVTAGSTVSIIPAVAGG